MPPSGGGGSVRASAGPALAVASAEPAALDRYQRFEDVVALIRTRRDVKLLVEVETSLRLASYTPGRIEFAPTDSAPRDLAARLSQQLQRWTGARWAVSVVAEAATATIAETRDAARLAQEAEALDHPLVAAVFAAFPQAKITDIRSREDLVREAALVALPEVEDEWDPFEDD